MRKIDIIFAFLAGEGVAWLIFGLLKGFTGMKFQWLYWVLPVLLPILALVGLWVSYLVGKKFLFVFQAAKFFLIGVLATLLNLGVLNFLMWIFAIVFGWGYNIFIGIAFIISTFGKYWGNKFWAFEKSEMVGAKKEFTQFFAVTLVGLGINVGVASFVVNTTGPQFNISPVIWANVGAIMAALVASVWNFIGYKFIVFKK